MAFTADLSAVAKRVRNKAAYKRFASAVDRYASILSCELDLETARSSIVKLRDTYVSMTVEREEQSPDDALLGGALFVQGIIFYARATDTGSNSRRPSGIAGKLTGAELDLHKKIMELRNDGLAHFGSGGDGWVNEAVLARFEDDHFKVQHAFTRFNYRGDLVREFASLIEHVKALAIAVRDERRDALIREIQRLAAEDVSFRQMVEVHPFVPENFWENGAAVPEVGEERHATTMVASHLRRPRSEEKP